MRAAAVKTTEANRSKFAKQFGSGPGDALIEQQLDASLDDGKVSGKSQRNVSSAFQVRGRGRVLDRARRGGGLRSRVSVGLNTTYARRPSDSRRSVRFRCIQGRGYMAPSVGGGPTVTTAPHTREHPTAPSLVTPPPHS